MASDYPPYVNAYGGIPSLFAAIKAAAVPPKFTYDFMTTSLGLKSSSYRAFIPMLKRLGFIDQGSVPTQVYRDFRDQQQSGAVMARQLTNAYSSLYTANEYAHQLNKKELQDKLRTITGAAEDDGNIPAVASTFIELAKFASWNGSTPTKVETTSKENNNGGGGEHIRGTNGREQILPAATGLGLSYTINLNLPATTEIEVFNAIFKSLRENLLK
jgi:hypothetical protein